MESETVSKANSSHTHVYGEPQIDHPNIDIQPFLVDQIKPLNINTCCGDAEIYKERCIDDLKKRHETKHHE